MSLLIHFVSRFQRIDIRHNDVDTLAWWKAFAAIADIPGSDTAGTAFPDVPRALPSKEFLTTLQVVETALQSAYEAIQARHVAHPQPKTVTEASTTGGSGTGEMGTEESDTASEDPVQESLERCEDALHEIRDARDTGSRVVRQLQEELEDARQTVRSSGAEQDKQFRREQDELATSTEALSRREDELRMGRLRRDGELMAERCSLDLRRSDLARAMDREVHLTPLDPDGGPTHEQAELERLVRALEQREEAIFLERCDQDAELHEERETLGKVAKTLAKKEEEAYLLRSEREKSISYEQCELQHWMKLCEGH